MKTAYSKFMWAFLLSTYLLSLVTYTKTVRSLWTKSVYIRADGSIDPPDAPIKTYDNVTYTLIDDVSGSIIVERSSIILDGKGYALRGEGSEFGIRSVGSVNVTVQNIRITGFQIAIDISQARHWIIASNSIANNGVGIRIYYLSSNNTVIRNYIADNDNGVKISAYSKFNEVINNTIVGCQIGMVITSFSNEDGYNTITGNWIINNKCGVLIDEPKHNTFYHNNFILNTYQVYIYSESENTWDNGSEGNYWNDYNGTDANSDGIGDTPYIINQNNIDNYPLIQPWASPWGDWKHYHGYDEIVNTLLFLNISFPKIVEVFSIGKSHQGRDMYCIKLTNETDPLPKPKVLFVGYHHARERISAELPLYFAVQAATSFGADKIMTYMLNNSEIYIIPALNVDGFEAVMQNEWQRKNTAPTDEDEDGLSDEDPPDDEDGDGYIEDLFYWDGNTYYFVRWEGIDDDGDGSLNEDWIGGVDLNRNYGYQWDAQCQSGSPYPRDEDYRGPAPFSEPETQALRDLAMMHDFKYAISFHSGAECVVYPWGYTTDPPPDEEKFVEIASEIAQLTGVWYSRSGDWYTTSGVWDDWMYGNRSTLALTCEIYANETAWQYEPGPKPNTWWEKGVFQFFNPEPNQIEKVILRWLPVFTYITSKAINEFRYHNICVIDVNLSKTNVGQGYTVNINVTVANKGDYTETFNVTLYANTTEIETKEVTLGNGSSLTVTYSWNTANFTFGNYTLWAYAWPIPSEVYMEDNTLNDGWIFVAGPGDLNADGEVDIYDCVIVAISFGLPPDNPYRNPNADINNDGYIDIYDLVIVAVNFGETYQYPN
ncbi:MAG: M14 family zinc carboxypeptidase [Candidatus Bathyarchaeia archaeon]